MNPTDLKSRTYIDFNKGKSKENYKFEVGDYVKISKYKNILEKFTLQVGYIKYFWFKKLKTFCRRDIFSNLNGERFFGTLYEKNWKKTNQKEFRVEKSNQEKR